MTDLNKVAPADQKARDNADKAADLAEKNAPQGDAQEAAELASKAEAARDAEAEGKTLKPRILTRKAFIGGRLYEAGEEAPTDADGNYTVVPKSTPAGALTEDQLKQLLAQVQASNKGTAAKKGDDE